MYTSFKEMKALAQSIKAENDFYKQFTDDLIENY